MNVLEKYLFSRSRSKDNSPGLGDYPNSMFLNLPNTCLICNSSGFIVMANASASDLTLFSQEELKEKKIFEFLQLDEDEFKVKLSGNMDKDTTLNFHTNLINKANEIKKVEITIIPIINKKILIGMYVVILEKSQKQELPLGKDFQSLVGQLIQAQKIAGTVSWIYSVEKDEFFCSEEMNRIFGIDSAYYPKKMDDYIKLVHPEDKVKVEKAIYEALKGTPTDIEYRILQDDGTTKHVRGKGTSVFNEQVQVVEILGTIQDITESYNIRKRFQVLVQDSNDIFEIITPEGIIQYTSPSIERQIRYKTEDLIGKEAFEFLDEEGKNIVSKMIELTLENPEKTIKRDVTVTTKDGKEFFIELGMKNQLNEPSIQGIVLNWRDITRRIKMQKRLEHISTHDVLTGLPNRSYFGNELKKQFRNSKTDKTSFALMMLNISGFKYINNSLGYKAGDEVIMQIANRLKSYLKEDMFLARYRGDYFAVIVSNLDKLEEYEQVAKELIKLFSDYFKFDVYNLDIGLNIGISVYPDDTEDLDSLKSNAFTALVRSKDKGDNKYTFYSPKMNVKSYKQFILRNDFKTAIEENQFRLHYQPQVDIKSNNILAAEALIRWEHPVWGMLSAGEFIHLAEETGYIVNLGNWILREVCSNYKKWLDVLVKQNCNTYV